MGGVAYVWANLRLFSRQLWSLESTGVIVAVFGAGFCLLDWTVLLDGGVRCKWLGLRAFYIHYLVNEESVSPGVLV